MVFANNAVYSRSESAIRFPAGSREVQLAGNVVLGEVIGLSKQQTSGFKTGNGLNDFSDVSWDAAKRNALPIDKSPLREAGVPEFQVDKDITEKLRSQPFSAGAFQQ